MAKRAYHNLGQNFCIKFLQSCHKPDSSLDPDAKHLFSCQVISFGHSQQKLVLGSSAFWLHKQAIDSFSDANKVFDLTASVYSQILPISEKPSQVAKYLDTLKPSITTNSLRISSTTLQPLQSRDTTSLNHDTPAHFGKWQNMSNTVFTEKYTGNNLRTQQCYTRRN